MSKITLFIPLLFVLLVGCSESKPEVEYFSLHALCDSSNATAEQVQAFLDLGVNVNGTEYGETPLHYAAFSANPKVVSVLLKAGAQVDAKSTSTGGTALHSAAGFNENPEVISLLLRAGADPDLRDDDGKTALDYARENEALQGTDALKALEAATSK